MITFRKAFFSLLVVTSLQVPVQAANNEYQDIPINKLPKDLQQQVNRVYNCTIDKFQPIQVGKSVYVLAKLMPHIKVFHVESNKMAHAKQFASQGYIDLQDAIAVGADMPDTGISNVFYIYKTDKELNISAPASTNLKTMLTIYKQFNCK